MTRELGSNEYFRDVDRLNEEADPKERSIVYGQECGPYSNLFCVYMLDLESLSPSTFLRIQRVVIALVAN
jgi:hypothetical protein